MNRFVLDNTLAMTWCFADEATEFTETLLNRLGDTDEALVPALWLYEVVNVVGIAVRKGRINEDKARTFLDTLAELPIEIENPVRTHTFTSLRTLASRYQLTAYDAAYLDLAMRHQLPLATLDNALARAASAAGVGLVGR